MNFSSDKIPEYTEKAKLGQDLFIPFGPVEIWQDGSLIQTVTLDKANCVFIAEENSIQWNAGSQNIIDNPNGNLAIFCSRTDLAAFGKTIISGTLFVDEAVNRREPYCDFIIKIQ